MNANDVFWLARYAHNTLAPLFAEAKAIEPSIQFNIEMAFADADSVHQKDIHLNLTAHWKPDGLFLMEWHTKTKADIDRVATQVRKRIVQMKADALLPA